MTNIHFTPGNGSNAPVIMLHGTGGTESDLLPIANALFPDQPKIGIRGRLIENDMTRYFAHDKDGGFDQDSLERETVWLLNEIDAQITEHQLAEDKVSVLGYSNGGNVALYAALTGRVFFKRAVLLHPMLVSANLSDDIADTDIKIWASYGLGDPIVSQANFDTLVHEADQRYFDITTFTTKQGHAISKSELLDAGKWLQKNPIE